MAEFKRAMDYIKAWKRHPSRSPYHYRPGWKYPQEDD